MEVYGDILLLKPKTQDQEKQDSWNTHNSLSALSSSKLEVERV